MDRIDVIWADSISFANEWMSKEEVMELTGREVVTGGFVVHRGEDYIRVAQSVFNGSYHNIMLIPTGAVREIKG